MLALLLTACGGQTGGDARRLIPTEAKAAVVIESVETLRARATQFLSGIQGTSGLLELVEGRYGVALTSREALAKSGVDPDRPLVVFRAGAATVVAAGVNDDEAFVALVETQLVKRAGGTKGETASPRVVSGPADADGVPRWKAAYGVTTRHVGVLVVPDDAAADAAGIYSKVIAGDADAFVTSTQAKAAKALSGEHGVAWVVFDGGAIEAPESLGMARGFLNRAVAGLQTWKGGIGLSAERVELHVASTVTAGEEGANTLPVEWLGTEPAGTVFADVFPKTTPIFVRGRFATSKIRKLPGFLRDRVLPKRIPGTGALPLPPLPEIIDFVGEDFAVALLGFDDGATVQSLASLARRRGNIYNQLHMALAATVPNEDKALAAFAPVAAGLAGAGWTVAPVNEGPYRGMTFVRGPATYSVLVGKGVIVFLTGAGEVGPFLDTAAGRALPLRTHAEGEPTAQRALGVAEGADRTALGLTTSFTKLTRSLADKGVPPYFLKIINDIRITSVAVGATKSEVTFDLEVAQ